MEGGQQEERKSRSRASPQESGRETARRICLTGRNGIDKQVEGGRSRSYRHRPAASKRPISSVACHVGTGRISVKRCIQYMFTKHDALMKAYASAAGVPHAREWRCWQKARLAPSDERRGNVGVVYLGLTTSGGKVRSSCWPPLALPERGNPRSDSTSMAAVNWR